MTMQRDLIYIWLRDGKEVMRGTWLQFVNYIHRNHAFSSDWALQHEGYSWRHND